MKVVKFNMISVLGCAKKMTICGACICNQCSRRSGDRMWKFSECFRKLQLPDNHTFPFHPLDGSMILWRKSAATSEPFTHTSAYLQTCIYRHTYCLYVYIIYLPSLILSPTVVEVNTRVHSFLFHEVPIHWHCSKPCIRYTKLLSKYYLLLFVKLSFFLLSC